MSKILKSWLILVTCCLIGCDSDYPSHLGQGGGVWLGPYDDNGNPTTNKKYYNQSDYHDRNLSQTGVWDRSVPLHTRQQKAKELGYEVPQE